MILLPTKSLLRQFEPVRNAAQHLLKNGRTRLGGSYLFVALPLILFLCFEQPVFQVPDEPAHFLRAYQVAEGNWFPQRRLAENGGMLLGGLVDENILRLGQEYGYLIFHGDRRVDPQKKQASAQLGWGGKEVWYDTPNVSIYPPFLYLLSSAGIIMGKAVGMSVTGTLHLARIVNGVCALLIASIAISLAGTGGAILFVLLLLPMVLAQFASVSQDALLIAISALCAVVMAKAYLYKSKRSFQIHVVLACGLLILISMARPPYVALSVLFLLLALLKWNERSAFLGFLAAFGISLFVPVLWASYVANNVSIPFGPAGVSYHKQLEYLINSPWVGLDILVNSIAVYASFYAESFIGKLGWLDTPFPQYYHRVAWIFIGLSVLFEFFRCRRDIRDKKRFLLIVGTGITLLGTILGIFITLYVSWTPVAAPVIEGVQGRYFIPISFFVLLTFATEKMKARDSSVCVARIETAMLATFALVTLMTVPWVIGIRYY